MHYVYFTKMLQTLDLAGLHAVKVIPIPASEWPSPTTRPAYSVLRRYALELQGRDTLPPWEIAELPEPLPLQWRHWTRLIGPAIVMMGIQIGGGEWLLGPEVTAKYGGGLMWNFDGEVGWHLALEVNEIRSFTEPGRFERQFNVGLFKEGL